MNPTLKWEGGRCVNAPEGVAVGVHRHVPGIGPAPHFWRLDDETGATLKSALLPSAEAAQLDCEATLWALGVLPLEDWVWRSATSESLAVGEGAAASVAKNVARPGCSWVAGVGALRASGECADQATARTTVRTVLRALIAQALRA